MATVIDPDTPDGELAGDPEQTHGFLDSLLDRATGRLNLERTGRVWEAVATARRLGKTGAGRLVAVIDGGFDLTVPGLAERIHPASLVRPHTAGAKGNHGTAVALLIREVAPDCALLLIDVCAHDPIQRSDVGAAIALATKNRADVINMSLQFPTDCPLRDTSWIRPDVLTSAAPPVKDFLDQIQAWIDNAEPYAGTRCSFGCPVCNALTAVPPSTLVVAASGNWKTPSCPACFDRVIGVGFERSTRVELNGSVWTTSDLPLSKGPVGRAELLVEEPPGFLGTSFAAPLISGFAALLPEPTTVATLGRSRRALTPVLTLAGMHWTLGREAPPGSPQLLQQGFVKFIDAIPDTHRHFDHDMTREACPACTLFLIDWYIVFVSMFIACGEPDRALGLARIAAVLAPETAGASGNYGLAAVRAAEKVDGQMRADLRHEAAVAYANAVRLAPDSDIYTAALCRLTGVT